MSNCFVSQREGWCCWIPSSKCKLSLETKDYCQFSKLLGNDQWPRPRMRVYMWRPKPINAPMSDSGENSDYFFPSSLASEKQHALWQKRNHNMCRISTRSWHLIPTRFTALRVGYLLPRGLDSRLIPSPEEVQNEAFPLHVPLAHGMTCRVGLEHTIRCRPTKMLVLRHCLLAARTPCSFKPHCHVDICETNWVQVGFALEMGENMVSVQLV